MLAICQKEEFPFRESSEFRDKCIILSVGKKLKTQAVDENPTEKRTGLNSLVNNAERDDISRITLKCKNVTASRAGCPIPLQHGDGRV